MIVTKLAIRLDAVAIPPCVRRMDRRKPIPHLSGRSRSVKVLKAIDIITTAVGYSSSSYDMFCGIHAMSQQQWTLYQ